MSHVLPNELIEKILDAAHCPPPTLALLALVSKTFLAMIRPRLYRSLKLSTTVSFEEDNKSVQICHHECEDDDAECEETDCRHECDSGCGGSNKEMVTDVRLRNDIHKLEQSLRKFDHLARFVEEISWALTNNAGDEAGAEAVGLEMEIRLFVAVLRQCRRLQKLAITSFGRLETIANAIAETTQVAQLTSFILIADLNKRARELWNTGNAVEIQRAETTAVLGLLVRLVKLQALELPWFPYCPSVTDITSPTFALRSFKFHNPSDSILSTAINYTFMAAILQSSALSLHRLSLLLDIGRPATPPHVFPSLQTIHCVVKSDDFPQETCKYILSTCPHLRSLHLIRTEDETAEEIIDPSLLRSLPPSLKSLCLVGVSFPATPFTNYAASCLPRLSKFRYRTDIYSRPGLPGSWTSEERSAFITLCRLRGIGR